MTKEVCVTLRGLQSGRKGEKDSRIETAARGDYYEKNGKHYVIFEEAVEGLAERVKSRLKFDADTVEVIRKGAVSTHMIFQKNKKNLTGYQTPFGQILMEIVTGEIRLVQSEECIRAEVEYTLETDGAPLSDCRMVIEIRPAI